MKGAKVKSAMAKRTLCKSLADFIMIVLACPLRLGPGIASRRGFPHTPMTGFTCFYPAGKVKPPALRPKDGHSCIRATLANPLIPRAA
jgi:hypothetical protein